jgi:hypothetical protein
MRRVLRLSALCLFLPAPLLALEPPRVMMCQIADESGTGWVPDFIMLTRQTSGPRQGRIEVFDPILRNLLGRPIQAQVTADDRGARSYGWALAGVRNQSGQRTERLDFRLTASKRDGAAEVTVTALGYDNVMVGHGVCGSPPRQ